MTRKLNVGAGSLRLDGFENVDIRAVGSDARRGHAGNLSFARDGTVDVVFANAVFEHVFLAHQLAVLREWRRVLTPTGVIVCLGLPDFRAIAAAYLADGPGTTGDRFDLFEVYRYTHGHPEWAAVPLWSRWDPARHVSSGPPGYLPQLHKALFDVGHLSDLLHDVGLPASLLRYAYPGEGGLAINLGFVAGAGCDDHAIAAQHLAEIPQVERFRQGDSATWHSLDPAADPEHHRMAHEARKLDKSGAPSRGRRALHHVRRRAATFMYTLVRPSHR